MAACCLSPCPKLAAFLAVAVAIVAVIPTLQGPQITVGPLKCTNLQTEHTGPLDTDSYTRRTLEFPCNGENCEAWLYMPKGIAGAKPPVVIMGHGMGGQKVGGSSCGTGALLARGAADANIAQPLLCKLPTKSPFSKQHHQL